MSHDVFVTAGFDKYAEGFEIAVECSCGAVLREVSDDREPQLGLDEIMDAAWRHRE